MQFEARSEERIAISSNAITRNRSLQHTTFDLYWENGIHENWRWTFPQSVSVSKGTSNHAETEFAEMRTTELDYRIPGIPLSVVQQQVTTRTETVKKLIQKFESHPNKMFILNNTGSINKFSEESQKLITDMNNTEIVEVCEASSKRQCLDCFFFCEIGIVYCSCGRCLKPSQSTKNADKKNYDVFSVPGFVIE